MKTMELSIKLMKKLNPKLVTISKVSRNLIQLETKNRFTLSLIITQDFPDIYNQKHNSIILDHKGQAIVEFLKLAKFKPYDDYDLNSFVKTTKEILSLLSVKNKKEALEKVKNGYVFELNQLLIDIFKLDYDLSKEYFSFGNDEYRPRYYRDVKTKNIINKKIKILDKNAYVFSENSVDLMIGLSHYTKTKMYPSVRPKTREVTQDEKYDFVTMSKPPKYFQNVKPKKEDLKGQKTIPIRNIYGQVFTFINTKSGFALKDSKGKIYSLSHPDLHFYIMD